MVRIKLTFKSWQSFMTILAFLGNPGAKIYQKKYTKTWFSLSIFILRGILIKTKVVCNMKFLDHALHLIY